MKNVIYFDWDGTLCSSKISQEANTLRNQFLGSDLSKEELEKMMFNNHNNHYGFVQDLIKKEIGVSNQKTIRTLQAMFFCYFYLKSLDIINENILFNLNELLKFKEENNLKFVIVTSLYEGIIKGALEKLKLDEVFDEVYSCDESLSNKKVDNLRLAIKNNIDNKSLFMIGDRAEDIDAGVENNIETIFCSYGHGDLDYATYSINSFNEIYEIIEKKLEK